MAWLANGRWIPETNKEAAEEARKHLLVRHPDYEDSWYIREIKNSKFTFYHIPEHRRTDEMFELHSFYWLL